MSTEIMSAVTSVVSTPIIPALPVKDDSIRVHGISVPQMITNSRWWNEGVSLYNSEAKVQVNLGKKERILIHMDTQEDVVKATISYPKAGRVDKKGYAAAKEQLKALVDSALKAEMAKGITYKKGDTVFTGFGACVQNTRLNQPLTLESWSIADAPFDEGGIEVVITGNLVIESMWKKIRGYGLKATLVPSDIFGLSIQAEDGCDINEWVILHSMSGLKGKPLDVVFFCHAIGSADVVVKDGVLIPTSGLYKGKEFDLTKKDSVIDKWRNVNAFTALFTFEFARASWEFVKECDIATGVYNTPGYDVINVSDVNENTVLITARVECLEGVAPLNIEVSLPEESSSATQLTPTTLACLTLQNRVVGEYMAALQGQTQKGVMALLHMFMNGSNNNGQIIAIQKQEVLTELAGIIKSSMSDKAILKAYGRKFPEGVIFSTAGEKQRQQFMHFGALSSISTFKGEGGDGVTHSLCQFLRLLPTLAGKSGSESLIHKEFSLLSEALKAWFGAQLESKNLRKKLVQSTKGTAFGLKIRTIDIPELNHQGKAPNCLPKAGMHPDDDVLRQLAMDPITKKIPANLCDEVVAEDGSVTLVFNPLKMNGKFVTVFRTPMPMQGACELVITEKVGVGHLALLMHVWSAFNEGDSDGDGVAIIPIFHYMDKAVADGKIAYANQHAIMIGMNTHPMGMGGYAVCYGDSFANWPCEEFVSYKDAWTKKKINIVPGSKAEEVLTKKGILPYVRRKQMKEFNQAYRGVNSHYRGAVGTSYNLSVAAVYECLQLQYTIWNGDTSEATAEKLRIALLASAASWRMVYEGLGLAGFTPEANKWFSLLNLSTWGNQWTSDFFGNPTFPSANTPKEKVFKFPEHIAAFGNDNVIPHKDASAIGAKLIALQTRIADGKALENPNSKGKQKRAANLMQRPDDMREAILCRVDRITEQGIDAILDEQLSKEGSDDQEQDYGDGEEATLSISSSLRAYLQNLDKFQPTIACPWRATNMALSSIFTKDSQTVLANFKRAKENDNVN